MAHSMPGIEHGVFPSQRVWFPMKKFAENVSPMILITCCILNGYTVEDDSCTRVALSVPIQPWLIVASDVPISWVQEHRSREAVFDHID
jgi:hypothetical protein